MEITEDVEQVIISSILQSENALLVAIDEISINDFILIRYGQIFNAAIDVYRDGCGLDMSLIYNRLREVESDVSASELASLYNLHCTFGNIKRYIKELRSRSLKRSVVNLAKRIISSDAMGYTGEELLTELSGKTFDIANNFNRTMAKPDIESIYAEVVADWRKVENGEQVCVPVNEVTTTSGILGWYPGHLICVGGYTSVGKSTYLAQVLVDACRENASCLVFSLEDGRKDKLIKLLANITDIPQRILMSGVLTDDQKRTISAGWQSMREYKLSVFDDIYDIESIRMQIIKARLRGQLNIVCIDYIQNIQGNGGIYERMSNSIILLQKMAKEYGVTIIVLSQVSNESMKGDSEIIGLKGAGELAAAADIVVWLKRVKGEGNEHKLELEIRKNRPFGETGIRRLRFSDRWTRIERG